MRRPRPGRHPCRPLPPVPEHGSDAWGNVGFSYFGLQKLLAHDAQRTRELSEFQDEAFRLGLAARSSLLGDPTEPTAEGNPANWVVGRPGAEPDVLLVIAADRDEKLAGVLQDIRDDAVTNGMMVLYEEQGRKLNPRGAEHFGFNAGVSQPGVRGRLANGPTEYITWTRDRR